MGHFSVETCAPRGSTLSANQQPGPTDAEVGHACGHNLIGAGCTGAALALKQMMQADGTTSYIFTCSNIA